MTEDISRAYLYPINKRQTGTIRLLKTLCVTFCAVSYALTPAVARTQRDFGLRFSHWEQSAIQTTAPCQIYAFFKHNGTFEHGDFLLYSRQDLIKYGHLFMDEEQVQKALADKNYKLSSEDCVYLMG